MSVQLTRPSGRLRVLSIDGGGMRGVYATTYLSMLAKNAAERRGVGDVDIGKAFNLIVGTSTGGIIACGLAAGISPTRLTELYRNNGRKIFPLKIPNNFGLELVRQLFVRPMYLASGAAAFERVLEETFGDWTLRDVYEERSIALAVPAIEMYTHRSWVFRTSHSTESSVNPNDRFRLVDVCLATSAAPLYRSMAPVVDPQDSKHRYVFVDGGLWANNPVLVGMVEALGMTREGDEIEIFSLGTCQCPPGEHIDVRHVHRSMREWKFGGEAMVVSLDAQEYGYDVMAQALSRHVNRRCRVVRFPRSDVPVSMASALDLDETSERSMEILVAQAHRDVALALKTCDSESDGGGQMLAGLLRDFPAT